MPLPFTLLALLPIAHVLAEPVDKALLWGPYRPNLYFGVRSRIPKGPSFGLMWGNLKDGRIDPHKLRHGCEQSDGIAEYGWTTYDVRSGGVQRIADPGNSLNLTVEFVKFPNRFGDWSARVKGEPVGQPNPNWNVSVVFYLEVEDPGGPEPSGVECVSSSNGRVKCLGDTAGWGHITRMPMPESKELSKTILRSIKVPKHRLWEAKSFFIQEEARPTDPHTFAPNQLHGGNVHYIQRFFYSSFNVGAFIKLQSNLNLIGSQFDILFTSNSVSKPVTSELLTKGIIESSASFSTKFAAAYQPSPLYGEMYVEFSKSLLSNLLGGIGYFFGDDKIKNSSKPIPSAQSQSSLPPINGEPSELYTSVPSRSFFPRGFLWDEGFHLLVVINWDIDLALDILQSWFARMDENGWIAREQILGSEARSKVPPEFQVQNPEYANPSTLFLVVEAFIDKVLGKTPYHGAKSIHLKTGKAKVFLKQLYPKLKKHYEWFFETQKGDPASTHGFDVSRPDFDVIGFRWRGQTIKHILTSGLDDYPRANPPQIGDLHVDALSWVGLMAGVLRKTADFLREEEDMRLFAHQKEQIERSIESVHWSEEAQTYCDTKVENSHRVHECHEGYISILPFLLGHVDAGHPHLLPILSLMRDERDLWSPFGLRSLSKSNPLYGMEENYWRGPIWINMNYLALERLLEVAKTEGLYQETAVGMYTELRANIISTVYNSWRNTGFAWEQYDPETGAGQRTQGFTGWTALVVNILAMPDLVDANGSVKIPGAHGGSDGVSVLGFFVLVLMFVGIGFRRKILGWCRRGSEDSEGFRMMRYERVTS